jgi:hypothetical protein
MDHEEIVFTQCTKFKLRPIPKSIHPTGRELSSVDDWWKVKKLNEHKLHLMNTRTCHFFKFGLDSIKEFIVDPDDASRGCLFLKSQIVLKGSLAVFSNSPK